MSQQSGRPSKPPPRRHPAHPPPVRRHNTPVILHVTVCTADRHAILATDTVHDALRMAYARKLEYAAQNPVRKALVDTSDEWPYQGKIGDLVWISG